MNTEYKYVKDAYGNVVAVENENSVVIQYRCYSWGNCTEINKNTNDLFVKINPIRYRIYYMDLETGYYFLQTRYYDPEIGAFISPDSTEYLDPESIGGLNLYTYCLNNPIKYFDPSGHFGIISIISFVFSVALSVGIVAYEDYKDDGALNASNKGWEGHAGAFFNGVVSAFGQRFLISLLTAFIGDIGESIINGEIEEDGFLATAGMSVLSSTISFGKCLGIWKENRRYSR